MSAAAGRYDAVLFDLDDTLLDHRGAANDALHGWAEHVSLRMPVDELVATWQVLERRYYDRYHRGELTKTEQRRARLRELLAPRTLSDDVADRLFAGYWQRYRAAWRLFPDAEAAVSRAVAARLRIGVLTNGDAADQRRKVAATALAGYALPVFASSELPAAKPDPRAFAFACSALAVTSDRCLMVGDSLVNDVDGALAAGLPAVLLDRHGGADAAGTTFPVIGSLDELQFR